MKTILQSLAILVIISSCSSIKPNTYGDIGQYDDTYASPKDEPESVPKSLEPIQTDNNNFDTKSQPVADEPEYRKYKETEGETITRQYDTSYRPVPSNTSSSSYSSSSSNAYNYDDDDDFSYGRSFQRLRYSDGYSDGYQDALYSNYNNGGGYYNSYYNNPTWGWNRPARNRFWVGYNPWNGWNVGYTYGYPAWGWRTSYYPCYNNYYDPWYGYSGGWGFYSNDYCSGTPYGYYQPLGYYNYGYPNYGYSNYGYYSNWYSYNNSYNYSPYYRIYRNYRSPWNRQSHVYYSNTGSGGGYKPAKNKINAPRETIGSNTPTKSRNDQVSPRGRSGMVQQDPKGGGTAFDPKKDRRDGMVGQTPGNNGNRLDLGGDAAPIPKDPKGRTEKLRDLPAEGLTPPSDGTATPLKNNMPGRMGQTNEAKPDFDQRNTAPQVQPNRENTANPSGRTTQNERYERSPDNSVETQKPNPERTVRRVREIDRSTPDYGRGQEEKTQRPSYSRDNSVPDERPRERNNSRTQSQDNTSNQREAETHTPEPRSYEPTENRNRRYEQPTRSEPKREEPQNNTPRYENNSRNQSQPSNSRQEEPRHNPAPRREEPQNTPRTYENNSRGNSQPSNQRNEEPRQNSTPRSYDNNRGGGSSSSPRSYNSGESRSSSGQSSTTGGGSSNGSSSSNRGRGR